MNRRNFLSSLGLALVSLPLVSKLVRSRDVVPAGSLKVGDTIRLRMRGVIGTDQAIVAFRRSHTCWETIAGTPPGPGDTVYINEGRRIVGDGVEDLNQMEVRRLADASYYSGSQWTRPYNFGEATNRAFSAQLASAPRPV